MYEDIVKQNIFECTTDDGFDWDKYQYLCDIYQDDDDEYCDYEYVDGDDYE